MLNALSLFFFAFFWAQNKKRNGQNFWNNVEQKMTIFFTIVLHEIVTILLQDLKWDNENFLARNGDYFFYWCVAWNSNNFLKKIWHEMKTLLSKNIAWNDIYFLLMSSMK